MPDVQGHFDRMNALANTRELSLQDACDRLRTPKEIAEYKEEYRKALSVLLEREVTLSEAENLILRSLPGGAHPAWISETIKESVRREDEARAVMLDRELSREAAGEPA